MALHAIRLLPSVFIFDLYLALQLLTDKTPPSDDKQCFEVQYCTIRSWHYTLQLNNHR